jgi:hypothetical protein
MKLPRFLCYTPKPSNYRADESARISREDKLRSSFPAREPQECREFLRDSTTARKDANQLAFIMGCRHLAQGPNSPRNEERRVTRSDGQKAPPSQSQTRVDREVRVQRKTVSADMFFSLRGGEEADRESPLADAAFAASTAVF